MAIQTIYNTVLLGPILVIIFRGISSKSLERESRPSAYL
jgi:hypothetical protein